jgi:hypothetical protein
MRHGKLWGILMALAIPCLTLAYPRQSPDPIVVPAYTAYCEPAPEALDINPDQPLSGWTNPHDHIVWYGQFSMTGELDLALKIRLAPGATARLRLSVGDSAATATVKGSADEMTVPFGKAEIVRPGTQRFELTGLSRSGMDFGSPIALVLSGPATEGAHFSAAKTRGAPSVHLTYPIPKDAKAVWYYNEVTPRVTPLWTYFCACGFARGYFGIQVNSPTERRIIFSVWDAGTEKVDRDKTAAIDRVDLLAKGEGVYADRFGNEGTGGHSHLVYPWKTGQTYRFLVSAQPEGNRTIYSGYFYFPEKHAWGLIARFRAPKDGGYLRGLYSFNEDFSGANGQRNRLAEFGPQWIKTADGSWTELTQARFTHTRDGVTERLDRGAGVTGDRFYLTNGGFDPLTLHYGDMLTRPSSHRSAPKIDLPPLAAAASSAR